MSTCKDCLHYDVCKKLSGYTEDFITSCEKNFEKYGDAKEKCECFKDRSKFVELPCKVGDTVYHLMLTCTIAKRKVIKFILTDTDGLCCVLDNGEIYSCAWRSIFLTKQEAEQALTDRSAER